MSLLLNSLGRDRGLYISRVFDAHCDTVGYFTGEKGSYHFLEINERAHVDLPRLKAGGVKAQVFALFIEPHFKPNEALKRCLYLLDAYHRVVKECPQELATVGNYAQLHEMAGTDKIAAILLVEGGEVLQGNLEVLGRLNRLGIRGLGLTWNTENQISGAAMEGAASRGLTRFGREIVREMNRLGMIIDLAHISRRGFYDVLDVSRVPVIVSHANVAAICDHPRNLTDQQMRALRENNGVLGISFYPPFISHQKADLARLLDHFVHAADIMGVNHLGIGSDFDGIDVVLEELKDVSFLPRLISGLYRRGFNKKEVGKILFDNFLRVAEETLTGENYEGIC
ncbi:MAG TPA: membrane dipeptidase [Firmicutes bacterium]|nr:membrane dipeptidase [Bacillota bacterium]